MVFTFSVSSRADFPLEERRRTLEILAPRRRVEFEIVLVEDLSMLVAIVVISEVKANKSRNEVEG